MPTFDHLFNPNIMGARALYMPKNLVIGSEKEFLQSILIHDTLDGSFFPLVKKYLEDRHSDRIFMPYIDEYNDQNKTYSKFCFGHISPKGHAELVYSGAYTDPVFTRIEVGKAEQLLEDKEVSDKFKKLFGFLALLFVSRGYKVVPNLN